MRYMQRYKPDVTGEQPYYAPKEESLQSKDSGVLRKLEEREKQFKYAKKLGNNITCHDEIYYICCVL